MVASFFSVLKLLFFRSFYAISHPAWPALLSKLTKMSETALVISSMVITE